MVQMESMQCFIYQQDVHEKCGACEINHKFNLPLFRPDGILPAIRICRKDFGKSDLIPAAGRAKMV